MQHRKKLGFRAKYVALSACLQLSSNALAGKRMTTGENFIGSDNADSGIKAIFNNVYSDFGQIAELMGGVAYLAGLIFVFASMLKIKQHRDNPAQVSISTALIFLLAGVGLIFLPSTLQEGATTIFTSIDTSYTGVSDSNISDNPWAKGG